MLSLSFLLCDQIPAKLLKHASLQIAPVISIIINKALDEGTFPNNLKKAEVIPVKNLTN